LHPPAVPAARGHQGDAGRARRGRALLRCVHPHQPLAHPGGVLLERPGARHCWLRYSHRPVWKCSVRWATSETSVRPVHASARRLCVTSLCYVVCLTSSAFAQRPQPFDQQLRDNQQRLESIRRERSDVEQELERLRTQVHSLSDELANIERQKETTNRIVNELDRQIYALSDQIDRTTVDLLLAQNALAEKRAVLERRLVDISKRGPLYAYQVLLAAESFGDLLSRYKYLYLVSRQDRLLANDMSKLQRRIGRERQTLVDARDVLGRRKHGRPEQYAHPVARDRNRGAGRHPRPRHRGRHREPRGAVRHLPQIGTDRPRGRLLQLLRLSERCHRDPGRARDQGTDRGPRGWWVERSGTSPALRDPGPGRHRPGPRQLAEDAPLTPIRSGSLFLPRSSAASTCVNRSSGRSTSVCGNATTPAVRLGTCPRGRSGKVWRARSCRSRSTKRRPPCASVSGSTRANSSPP